VVCGRHLAAGVRRRLAEGAACVARGLSRRFRQRPSCHESSWNSSKPGAPPPLRASSSSSSSARLLAELPPLAVGGRHWQPSPAAADPLPCLVARLCAQRHSVRSPGPRRSMRVLIPWPSPDRGLQKRLWGATTGICHGVPVQHPRQSLASVAVDRWQRGFASASGASNGSGLSQDSSCTPRRSAGTKRLESSRVAGSNGGGSFLGAPGVYQRRRKRQSCMGELEGARACRRSQSLTWRPPLRSPHPPRGRTPGWHLRQLGPAPLAGAGPS